MKKPHWPNYQGFRDISLGLQRVEQLLERLGNPHLSLPPVVHIAGTNGKGSTLAFIRSILEESGYSVHAYTSPHLIDFNERFVLAGKKISDGYLTEILEECRVATSDDINETYFEGVTVAAFLAFSKIKADIVLLETGLGGRLDATNVIPAPILSIITSISMDHEAFLGDNIVSIASEKAGIIKEKCPCILAKQRQEEVQSVIRKRCKELNAPLILSSPHVNDVSLLGLKGKHQLENANTAITAINELKKTLKLNGITTENIAQGLKKATWPSRLQHITYGNLISQLPNDVELWLDGGHNVAAAQALTTFMEESTADTKWHIIFASLKTKDAKSFLDIVMQKVYSCYCVTIPKEESMYSSNELYQLTSTSQKSVFKSETLSDALGSIKNKIVQDSHVPHKVLICGSLHFAGYVLELNKG